MICVSFVAQKVFMSNIVRRIYQVRKYDEDDEETQALQISDNFWSDSQRD